MPDLIRVFTGSTGLNVKIDPVRLKYHPKTGVQELAVAVNVDIDDTGRVSRRKGATKQLSGNCHSPFCDGGDAMIVKDDALCVLHSDYSTTPIRNVTPGARMNYCQVDNVIYYTNGYERGKLKTGGEFDGASYAWNKPSDYVGPETKRVLSDPPTGTILEYFAGRMWIVQGKNAWYSEPHNLSAFDLADSLLSFEDRVVMIRATIDGLYISTDKRVMFIAGTDPASMSESIVADYPAIEGTDVKFIGRAFYRKGGTITVTSVGGSLCAIWQAKEGICFGGPEGQFINLTEDKLVLPNALTGAGLVYNGKYIGNMNP